MCREPLDCSKLSRAHVVCVYILLLGWRGWDEGIHEHNRSPGPHRLDNMGRQILRYLSLERQEIHRKDPDGALKS